jgi:CubicO group peptidase (beta-lactamase class C family)
MTSIFKLIFIFVFIFIGMTDAQADVKVNSDDVVAWADAYFKEAMEKHRISGAGIVVTKGGKPIIMKGYGFHDMATGVSFDPLKTRVRIGPYKRPRRSNK